MRIFAIGSLTIAGLAVGWHLWEGQSAVVTIQPDEEHQVMSGWEVTLRLWETNKAEDRFDDSWEQYGTEIFDRLVNELGINRVRLEIKSGVENPVDYWALFEGGEIGYREYKKRYYEKVNDNNDPSLLNPAGIHFSMLDYQVEKMLLPIRELVEANGEKLYINLCYVDFKGIGSQGTLDHANNSEEYAELIAATFDHLDAKYGITADALEVVLEPDNSVGWRGKQIGNGMVAAGKRLAAAGVRLDVIAPSTSYASRGPDYFDEIMNVAGAEQFMSTLAYHRYDLVPDFVTLPPIKRRVEQYGLRSAMLESLGAGVAELYADLTETNVSAWQQYGIAVQLSKDFVLKHGYFYGLADDGNGKTSIRLSRSGRELMQYFKYVRRGAVRIGATSDNESQRPVAFRNANGSYAVVINSLRPAKLIIMQLPAGSYGIRYTTADQFHVLLGEENIVTGDMLEFVMPDSGTVTVFQK